MGVEPVASPRTAFRPCALADRMASAIRSATARASAGGVSKTRVRIRSRDSATGTGRGPRAPEGPRASRGSFTCMSYRAPSGAVDGQAEKLLPQPQPPEAFGFLKVKPEPCIDVT